MATLAENEIGRGGAGCAEHDTTNSGEPRVSPRNSTVVKSDADTWNEVLERACSGLSDGTSEEMVAVANSQEVQKMLDVLLPAHFNTWKLKSLESILVFVLLNYFVVRQECHELKADRGNYEDHITRLKKRVADLEEEVVELKHQRTIEQRNQRKSPPRRDHDATNHTETLEEVKKENARLLKAQEELHHINHQWAQDYDSLMQQISNTSFSMSSSSSSQQGCSNCLAAEHQVETLARKCEQMEQMQKKMTCEIERREAENKRLADTNQAIQFQLQELGDLQAAMQIKADYGRMKWRCKQLEGENRDLVCERLRLQQQLDKVRQVFIQLFPYGTGPSVTKTRPTHLTTAPRHYCRQRSESTPPTPPGLIARGVQHQGGAVERDLKQQPHSDNTLHQIKMPNGVSPHEEEPRTWPEAPQKQRSESVLPMHLLQCPNCSLYFSRTEGDCRRFLDHVQSGCGSASQ